MKRNRKFDCFIACILFQPYVGAFLPRSNKTSPFQPLDNFNSRSKRKLHIETTIFSPVKSISSFVSASKYNSIASLIFLIASSLFSPCDMQPGKDGTYAVKPPSSCGSKTIVNFILPIKQNKYINMTVFN